MVDITPAVITATKEHLVSEDGIRVVAEAVADTITGTDFKTTIAEGAAKEIASTIDITPITKEVVDAVTKNTKVITELQVKHNGNTITISTPHKSFELLLNVMATQLPVMLTGEAGSGKTQSVVEASKVLGLNYFALSVGEQTTKSDLLGFIDATGNYRSTAFRSAFELGGVFLLDEVDAGNPNVLLAINTAISNGFVEFPDKKVTAHKDFMVVATANTYGNGATTQYVGRNKLDKATLNRFVVIDWDRDDNLERMLVSNKEWLDVVNEAREATKEVEGHLISMRTTMYGDKLLAQGIDIEAVIKMTVAVGLDDYAMTKIDKLIKKYKNQMNHSIEIGTKVLVVGGEHQGKDGTVEAKYPDSTLVIRNRDEKFKVLKKEVIVI